MLPAKSRTKASTDPGTFVPRHVRYLGADQTCVEWEASKAGRLERLSLKTLSAHPEAPLGCRKTPSLHRLPLGIGRGLIPSSHAIGDAETLAGLSLGKKASS